MPGDNRDPRVLGPSDLGGFLALTSRDRVVNVFAESRARSTSLDPRWLGGAVWGIDESDTLVAACHAAANLVPVECSSEHAGRFAEKAAGEPHRTWATVVGPTDAVAAMWEVLRPVVGPAREERWDQPHLEIDHDPRVPGDPRVRATAEADLDLLYPACVAMYTEEVGVSPEASGGADLYRARVRQLLTRRRSFSRIDDGEVVFKAEVACASPGAAQVQGVWVPPHRRGEGLATAGMAAVVELVRREIAPVVSLYVNDYNTAARRAYDRVGFRQTATFSTVMLP